MRQPVLSPDGKTIALVTDAPDPDQSNVVLQFFDVSSKKLTRAGVHENQVLGHQDPEWRPDGKFLLYTQNGRDGAKGAPIIMRYEPVSKKARAVTTAGYMQASYSPDGRYMAATRTSSLGTDVVILDANSGRELMRITNDASSWAPAWSPAGDGIAFLHVVGQTVDLRLAKLDGQPGAWTVSATIDLTEVSGLDAASRPDWFIPANLLPALPTPAPSSGGSAAPTVASPSP
jgi:Tol biopolymer transport system component